MNKEQKVAAVLAGAYACVIVGLAVDGIKVNRRNRKRFKRVSEMTSVKEQAIQRLNEMMNDPNTTHTELLQACKDEAAFLGIVLHQPL